MEDVKAIKVISESKTLVKHKSCECRCEFHGSMISINLNVKDQ